MLHIPCCCPWRRAVPAFRSSVRKILQDAVNMHLESGYVAIRAGCSEISFEGGCPTHVHRELAGGYAVVSRWWHEFSDLNLGDKLSAPSPHPRAAFSG